MLFYYLKNLIMERDYITPKTFADSMFGREDERKATCINCKKVWYEIHFKDGVCNECQEKGLPGRTKMEKDAKRKTIILIITIMVAGIFLMKYFI